MVHAMSFVYFCTAIPLVAFAPEVGIPMWGLIYAPPAITILKAIETPRYASDFSSALDLGSLTLQSFTQVTSPDVVLGAFRERDVVASNIGGSDRPARSWQSERVGHQ